MNIHNVSRMGAANPYYKQQETKNAGKTGDRRGRTDEVSISAQAKELAALDPSRQARVEQLKDSVADGTYRVDARLIAEKLIKYFQ